MMQVFTHYFLHLGFPLLIALVFFKKQWKKTYLLLLATMLVDLDHLLANPVFQPDRCGVGFHPLHSFYAIPIYFVMVFVKGNTRIIGIGLLLHMLTDLLDCLFIFDKCHSCLKDAPALPLVNTLLNWLGIA